ncbi:6317_t:CDS:2 [Rhizophagus irregularis]|nr:6317_t:CDS:2 [Rhizophagus irregularis]
MLYSFQKSLPKFKNCSLWDVMEGLGHAQGWQSSHYFSVPTKAATTKECISSLADSSGSSREGNNGNSNDLP